MFKTKSIGYEHLNCARIFYLNNWFPKRDNEGVRGVKHLVTENGSQLIQLRDK